MSGERPTNPEALRPSGTVPAIELPRDPHLPRELRDSERKGEFLQSAIDAGGTSFRDYVGVGEEQGYFARELAVYEREGLPCRRCKAKVRRTTDQGRSTYWCAGCQR